MSLCIRVEVFNDRRAPPQVQIEGLQLEGKDKRKESYSSEPVDQDRQIHSLLFRIVRRRENNDYGKDVS